MAKKTKAAGKRAAKKDPGRPAAARRPNKTETKSRRDAPAASKRTAARPASGGGPKKRTRRKPAKNTAEADRGGQFFKKIRMWRLLHASPGRVWNKQDLAEEFFKDGDLDCDSDDADGAADVSGEAPMEWISTGPRGEGRWKLKIRNKHKKDVQRTVESLEKLRIGVFDCDKNGTALTRGELDQRLENNPFEERYWKYDRDGKWARTFESLQTTHLLSGSALVGLKTLSDLLGPMTGTPHQQSVRTILDSLLRMVPAQLRAEAVQQSRAWLHAVGSTHKYLKRKDDLRRWYVATLNRKQVLLQYAKPGASYLAEPGDRKGLRTIAAFGTKFDSEESSLYLIGSEWEPVNGPDGKVRMGWSAPKQFKFDRVISVQATDDSNPDLSKIPRHHLIKRDGVAISRELLDLERLYSDSAGSYLSYEPPVDVEFLIQAPTEDAEDLRRAANWMAWVQEKPFHPKQVVWAEDGGRRLRVVINRCNADEVLSRLLRLGIDFEIIRPVELRNRMQSDASKIADRHK